MKIIVSVLDDYDLIDIVPKLIEKGMTCIYELSTIKVISGNIDSIEELKEIKGIIVEEDREMTL